MDNLSLTRRRGKLRHEEAHAEESHAEEVAQVGLACRSGTGSGMTWIGRHEEEEKHPAAGRSSGAHR